MSVGEVSPSTVVWQRPGLRALISINEDKFSQAAKMCGGRPQVI